MRWLQCTLVPVVALGAACAAGCTIYTRTPQVTATVATETATPEEEAGGAPRSSVAAMFYQDLVHIAPPARGPQRIIVRSHQRNR